MMQKKGGILIAAFIYILCAKTPAQKNKNLTLTKSKLFKETLLSHFLKNLLSYAEKVLSTGESTRLQIKTCGCSVTLLQIHSGIGKDFMATSPYLLLTVSKTV